MCMMCTVSSLDMQVGYSVTWISEFIGLINETKFQLRQAQRPAAGAWPRSPQQAKVEAEAPQEPIAGPRMRSS